MRLDPLRRRATEHRVAYGIVRVLVSVSYPFSKDLDVAPRCCADPDFSQQVRIGWLCYAPDLGRRPDSQRLDCLLDKRSLVAPNARRCHDHLPNPPGSSLASEPCVKLERGLKAHRLLSALSSQLQRLLRGAPASQLADVSVREAEVLLGMAVGQEVGTKQPTTLADRDNLLISLARPRGIEPLFSP